MINLHELTGDALTLRAQLDECETQEEYDAVWAQIEANNNDIAMKAEIFARIMRNLEAEAEAQAAEAERLSKRSRARSNAAKRIKERLLNTMQLLGIKKINTTIGDWRVQPNPARVEITDIAAIPDEYIKPQPREADKTKIKQWFEQTGEILPGCDIVKSEGVRFR